jgi:predicted enzyme related to lactoylglutathione lyase
MDVKGITWHAVTVDDAAHAATKRLYSETFGARIGVETSDFTMFHFPNGTVVELYALTNVPSYGFNDGIAFGFRVDDIEAATSELAAAGIELLGEVVHLPEIDYAYTHFRGPDGRVYGLNQKGAAV